MSFGDQFHMQRLGTGAAAGIWTDLLSQKIGNNLRVTVDVFKGAISSTSQALDGTASQEAQNRQ
jgi:hypothetical protein